MTTISEEYRELNRQLHESNAGYGANGHRYAPLILQLANAVGARNVLDYGAGKGTLAPVLRANGLEVREYDPAFITKCATPEPADIVYCGDVAEHVEPEFLTSFLDDLRRVTIRRLVLVVATRPAKKTLPDGRNAHLIVEPLMWWLPKLQERFAMEEVHGNEREFIFTGEPK